MDEGTVMTAMEPTSLDDHDGDQQVAGLNHADHRNSSVLRSIDPLEVEGRDGLLQTASTTSLEEQQKLSSSDMWQTVAGVAGNVLEWYDFAIFGYLGDVIGVVFFPPNQAGDASTVEAFAVFGGAFLVRPIGGLLMGYIGDVYGRKKALVISIFLMAFPTFAMGCLPSYSQVGPVAYVLLIIVRLLQGLSVGGQLMSSLVFTLESHDPSKWGLYGSFVMAAANFGTLLGGIAGYILRTALTQEQLIAWGWRLPFLSGILVSFSGFYLRSHGGDHAGGQPEYHTARHLTAVEPDEIADNPTVINSVPQSTNPVRLAFAWKNLRSLLAASMVPMLWSGGFYLAFVWMAIFMADLLQNPVPHAFGVNSMALLISVCLFFPIAGMLSDRYGRKPIMTIGGVFIGIFSPVIVAAITLGNPLLAFVSQSVLGIAVSLWGAPMCAWLVEGFEPQIRLTSVSIGYNIGHALVGGSAPTLATILVDKVSPWSPGWILSVLALIGLIGLRCVAPTPPDKQFLALSQQVSSVSVLNGDDDEEDELL